MRRIAIGGCCALALPAAANAQSDWFSSTYQTYKASISAPKAAPIGC